MSFFNRFGKHNQQPQPQYPPQQPPAAAAPMPQPAAAPQPTPPAPPAQPAQTAPQAPPAPPEAPAPYSQPRLPARDPYTFKYLEEGVTVDSAGDELPEGYVDGDVITIALAGARNSGKSVYIGVMLEKLREYAFECGHVFNPTDDTEIEWKTTYQEPLYVKGESLQATPLSYNRPLIFDLGYKLGSDSGRKLFIVIRDVAGETLRRANFESNLDNVEVFRHAHTTIFLFDPLSVTKIRDLLRHAIENKATIPDFHHDEDDDPEKIVMSIKKIMDDPQYEPNFAITVSKFDTLHQLANLPTEHTVGTTAVQTVNWPRVMSNYGLAVCREGAANNEPYDADDQRLLEMEVKSILQELAGSSFLNQIAQPLPGHRRLPIQFFAVSALGKNLMKTNCLSDTGISPFRVLDPLRATFHRLQVLEPVQH